MKMLAAAAGLLVIAFALPALAQNAGPPANSKPQQICLGPFISPTGDILRTKVVDPQTILFYMRNGKIWKNTLRAPCRGLEFHGFSFVTHYTELCSNSAAIQVVVTGEVCQLGYFTPYTAPATH
ncbi:MAG TPA: hypothetical protein VMD53_15500 [Rhizomicrobium sp.]|nr:hypothetical protein [Rhizomicrobium sp.]